VNGPDACRFCRLYALALPAFAFAIGVFTSTLYFAPPSHASGAGIAISLLRSSAPMACGSALLLALVLWLQPLSASALRADLNRITRRACFVSAPGYLVAAGLVIVACFAVSSLFPRHDSGGFAGSLSLLRWQDVAVGAGATLLDTALIVGLGRRYAERLRAGASSLPAKLIIIVTVTVPLRATVALIFSSLLSG
jgi:hypothetical protein